MLQNKRKFVAWRRRLTKGAREASHKQLEDAGDWLESFETVCGAMVFFGVAFEVFIAAKNPPYGSILERWGSSIADAFVALGVLGEMLASARGRIIQGELTRRSNQDLADTRVLATFADVEAGNANDAAVRALRELAEAKRWLAEANERAAILEKSAAEARERTAIIEQLTAGRRISENGKHALADIVRKLPHPLVVTVEWQIGDSEAFALSYGLLHVFNDAGSTAIRHAPNSFVEAPVFGVWVTCISPLIGNAFAEELVKSDIAAKAVMLDLKSKAPADVLTPT